MFVIFAIVSYVYRWVVTFIILFFFSNFLKPYKLEIVGQMLAFAALGSMLGWPLYRLGKNLTPSREASRHETLACGRHRAAS